MLLSRFTLNAKELKSQTKRIIRVKKKFYRVKNCLDKYFNLYIYTSICYLPTNPLQRYRIIWRNKNTKLNIILLKINKNKLFFK